MPDLSVNVDGLRLPNPFVIASGPPGTNAAVIMRAFEEGWGGVVSKTCLLDHRKIVNVSPRYARMRVGGAGSEIAKWSNGQMTKGGTGGTGGAGVGGGEIVGWENIELISDRPFEDWLDDFRRVKDRFPDGVLIASVMEEFSRDAWAEIIGRCEDAGVDGFELNLSCPHGLPEQRMGAAMGQEPEIIEEVCSWARGATRRPIWAKLTPNVTRIEDAARAALKAGCSGVSAINTVLCVMGVDLETLRPLPTVEGYSTAGGYSGRAIRPIALRMAMESAMVIEAEFPGRSLSALGGIETGEDAAQFMLLGADTVQACTGVMIHGYGLVHELKRGLERFMERHGFERVEEFRGRSLAFMTTHAELVARQRAARQKAAGLAPTVLTDVQWRADRFVQQSEGLLNQP